MAPLREHESSAEHADLVGAIETADVEGAVKVARRHVERTRTAYHRAKRSPADGRGPLT